MFEKFAEKFNRKNAAEEIQFKSFGETVSEDIAGAQENAEAAQTPAAQESSKGSNIELKITRPESFSEVSTIADYLLDGCTVVINMELIDKPTGLRMLDFLNGVTYSLGGDIKNAAPGTYIITPHNVDIT